MARRRSKRSSGGGLGTLLIVALVLIVYLPGSAEDIPWTSLVVLVVGGVAVVWLLRQLTKPKTPTAQELSARFSAVGSMSGAQFEVFVADLFRALGHRAQVMGKSGDQGVDVIVDRGGERVAVQCKNYKRRVGNKPVQEVYAGAKHHRCSRAWVVAPAGYTTGAHELARSTEVSLFDAVGIRRWIKQVDEIEKKRVRAV